MEDGIFFNQSKYIKEMLKKFRLEDSKPTKTPMLTEIKLTKDDEADSVDSSKYRESRYVHEGRTIHPSLYNDLSDDSVAKFTTIGFDYLLSLDEQICLRTRKVGKSKWTQLSTSSSTESQPSDNEDFPSTKLSPRSYSRALKDDPNMSKEQRETRGMFKNLGRALHNFARLLKKGVVPFEEQSDDLKKKLAKNNEAKMVLYNALPKKEYERIFMCKTAKDIWQSLLITHQGNSQVKDNKINLLVQQYEQFTILEEESIDSGFARFNTIITSLKALDEGFSSKNYVRKFLRALHPKWRAKVTAIEESKDLSSLALDELIGNLKVHEVVMEKDSKIYRGKKERVKSIALKAENESSNDETLTSGSDDEEYALAVRNFIKFFRRKAKFVRQPREEKKSFRQWDEKKGKSNRKCFRCGDPNHLIGDCAIPSHNKDQKAFIRGSWSDSENDAKDKTSDKTCLMAQSLNELCLRTCLELDEWIKDSGCSKHMTSNKSLFSTYKAYDEGYSQNSKAYIVLNEHTMKVEESLNVTFDESPPLTKLSPLVDDDVGEEKAIRKNTKIVNTNNEDDESIKVDEIVNIKESKNHLLDQVT
ncbi:zf-CCHC domain-containing protein [Tanacetum coccineum]